MDEATINREFSAAMRVARDVYQGSGKIGFQAKVCAGGLFTPSNFSQIINNDKGTKEPRRRAAVERVNELLPDFPAKTYEDFLHLGRWILDGNVAMFDRDSVACVGYDERNPPEGVDADDFAELLFWLKRYPAMIRSLLEAARAYRFSKGE